MKKEIADFIHLNGYSADDKSRKFSLFTFSQIYSKKKPEYNRRTNSLNFGYEINFTVSTVIEELLVSVIENQMRTDGVWLDNNSLSLSGIKVHQAPKFNNPVEIKMLSPMTLYSSENGKYFYYNPSDIVFSDYIKSNLLNKYAAYTKNGNSNELAFGIKPLFNDFKSKRNKAIIDYDNFIIEAYRGLYEIWGSIELIQFAYDVGLGGKNAQGLGLWEVYRR